MKGEFLRQAVFVRRSFFPAWDRSQHWKVVQVADLDGADGRCDREKKTVSILKGIGGDNLTATLIHEIAHAVTDDHHGSRWQTRTEKAAVRADDLGLAALGNNLRRMVANYRDGGLRVTATMVYGEISHCVLDSPSVTFAQAVDFVRRSYGLPRAKFLRRFRRAKRVFDAARAETQHHAEAKAKLLAMK
jgi:hypothetical protein